MEGWKYINYTSLSKEAPLFTLGFTTPRWGLEPFAANLVATTNSLAARDEFENGTIFGTGMPYSCDANLREVYDNQPPWRVIELNGQTGLGSEFFRVTRRNITRSSVICDENQTCTDTGCIVVVEEAFKHTNVLEVVHGVTCMLITILTIVVYLFLRRDYEPKIRDPTTGVNPIGVQPEHLRNRYQPPSSRFRRPIARGVPNITSAPDFSTSIVGLTFDKTLRSGRTARPVAVEEQNWAPPQVVDVEHELADDLNPQDFSRSIVRCQNLLREVARIDRVISGMQRVREADVARRDELRQRGNATFDEVRRVVVALSRIPNLSDEHNAIVQAIVQSINDQPPLRY